jgi:protoheme IX farnesyltransferase
LATCWQLKQPVDWVHMIIFCIGGFLVTGASNIINQIIEVDLDKLMREQPAGHCLQAGCLYWKQPYLLQGYWLYRSFPLFTFINLLTALITFLSLVLYAFVYTPLKRVGPVAVFVGAFPGALPPLIGWVAATNMLEVGAFTYLLYNLYGSFRTSGP